jgi:hypothetical protein
MRTGGSRILADFYQYIVSDCGDSAIFASSISSMQKNIRSAVSKSGIRFCRTNVFVCLEIVLQNIEIAHEPSGHARGHALADQTQEIINLKN